MSTDDILLLSDDFLDGSETSWDTANRKTNDNSILTINTTISTNNNASKYHKPVPNQSSSSNNKSQISVNKLPERYRSIFPFSHFNQMQSESFDIIYGAEESCVISSPTGSGKTVLFELAIIKLLDKKLNYNDNDIKNSKILYMAPTKALCTERHEDWRKKFQPLNCTVGLLTGDSSFSELDSVKRSDIIICTPEKWDALTRRWNDYRKLLDLVKLLLVDEVHFIRETRGTSLEVVITRMLTLSLNLRTIALSATVPNIHDVSKWLSKANTENAENIHTLIYDDNYRAVTLKKTVYGYKTAGSINPFQLESFYNGKLPEVIRIHSKNKPVLIFCPTRNSTISTAKYLAQNMLNPKGQINDFPNGINREMVELIQNGIAYHHAGLGLNERKFIEENFIAGNIRILCSTSTLAVGVNLPAYLVIIKGTKIWNNDTMAEYNELDLMQMMGRAGRPQFEKEGACVIMTDDSQKDRYIRLIKGTEKLESSLHLSIYENITAEITLKTIRSLETAFTWLKSTFFYQRYLQNPTAYPTIFSKMNIGKSFETQLKIFLKDILDELIVEQIIEVVGNQYVSTAYGSALSKSYVLYETIKIFTKSKSRLTLADILIMISKSHEFLNLRIKMAQKRIYKEINESPLIFHKLESKKIENYYDKVAILIQYELGGIEYPTYQGSKKLFYEFISEKMVVFKNIPRILRAVIEIFHFKKDAITLLNVLKLNRCIHAKSWENSSLVLKQFEGIGLAYAKKLMTKGISNIEKIKNLSREKLEFYLGLKPGAGQKIAKSISKMPTLCLKVEDIRCKNNGFVQFTVIVDLLNDVGKVTHLWNGSFTHIIVLTDVSGEVLDFRRLPLKKLTGGKQFMLQTTLKFKTDYIKVYLNCDEIAGIGEQFILDVSNATKCLPDENAKQKLIDDYQEISINRSSSFQFDDEDDQFINEILKDKSKENIIELQKPVQGIREVVNKIPEINKSANTSTDFNSSTSIEPSFTECLHKCADRLKCRHICCKEGIPKNKVKACKHACKDKSKCRHLCCREQVEYEKAKKNKREKQKKKEKTYRQQSLDLSMFSNHSKNEDIFSDDVENDSGIEMVNGLNEKSHIKPKAKRIPVFLRRIEKDPTIEIDKDEEDDSGEFKYKNVITSKYFAIKKRGLLDDDSDLDIFSDSFDSSINKVFNTQPKRHKPIPTNNSIQKLGEIINLRKVNDVVNVIKTNHKLNKINNNRKFNISQVDDDIIIVTQTLPKVVPIHSLADLESKPKLIKEFDISKHERDANYSIVEESINVSSSYPEEKDEERGHDNTTMTSVVDDFAINGEVFDKEALDFLDSDVEFS